MKELRILVCATIVALVLLPCFASAQSADPPTCCFGGKGGGGGGPLVSSGASQATADTANQIVISDDGLSAMGMSRSDFVDRLAGSLFFGRNVDLIVSTSRSVAPRTGVLGKSGDEAEDSAAAEGTLLAVQEKRLYQIPRARLRAADIDALDRFYITDGHIYIEIIFKRVDSSGATR